MQRRLLRGQPASDQSVASDPVGYGDDVDPTDFSADGFTFDGRSIAPEREAGARAPSPPGPPPGPTGPEDHGGYYDPVFDDRLPPRRRRWPRLLFAALIVFALAGVAQLLYARYVWQNVERVAVAGALDPSPGTKVGLNVLIVGSDSRADISADDPNAGAILGGGLSGERTDTIMLLHISEAGTTSMAIPRDLFVTISGSGEQQRINAAIQGGPDRLINTVRDNLGVPVHHFMEVDFSGFVGLVDAVGGVSINFEHPAYDTRSGFDQVPAGDIGLNGSQALAYVRSRYYTEIIDGREVVDGRSDLGRVERQQDFLRAVLSEVTSARNPITLNRAATSLADHIVIDDAMTFRGSLGIARRLAAGAPVSVTLPTRGFTTAGGAQVLGLVDGEAGPILDNFR